MGLFGKGSKLYGIFKMKCPKCHEGDLYYTKTASFSRPFDMQSECSHCNQSFMPEPGFYYGAMFVSYIATAFFCLGFVGLLHWVLEWSVNLSFIALIVVMGLSFVWVFRISRSVWINLMLKYDKERAGLHIKK